MAALLIASPLTGVASGAAPAPAPLFAEAVYVETAGSPAAPGGEEGTRRLAWARRYRCCGGGTEGLDAWLRRQGPTPPSAPVVERLAVGSVRLTDSYRPVPAVTADLVGGDGALLVTAGRPAIRFDGFRVKAAADCRSGVRDVSMTFANLAVDGVPLAAAPPPNTTIPLGAWTLVVNEQRPSDRGTGVRVAALRLVAGPLVPASSPREVVVGQVAVAASCAPARADGGGAHQRAPVQVRQAAAGRARGGLVSWRLTVANPGPEPCHVERVVLHGPEASELVATSGGLGATGDVSLVSAHASPYDRELGHGAVVPPGAALHQLVTYRLAAKQVYRRPDVAVDHAATVHCAAAGFGFGGYGAAIRPLL